MSVSKTTDTGVSWTRYNIGTATGYVYAVAVDPTNSNVIYAGGYESSATAIYKTTNSGTNWNKLSTTGMSGYVYALAIDPDDPATLFAGTSSSLYKSTDGGSTWSTTGFSGGRTQALLIDNSAVDATIIYAGTYSNGVYRSPDDGGSWEQMNDGLVDKNINCLGVNPLNYVFAGTNGGSMYRYEISVGLEENAEAVHVDNMFFACPNPTKGTTTINYALNTPTAMTLSIYDTQGRLVRTIAQGWRDAGTYTVTWHGLDDRGNAVAAGIYFYKLTTAENTFVQKLVLVR